MLVPLLLRRACPLLLLTLVTACGTSTNSGNDPGSEPHRGPGTDAPVEQRTQPPQDPIPLPDLQNGLGDHRSDPTGGGLGKR